MKPSQILYFLRPDGSTTSKWVGLSPFVIIGAPFMYGDARKKSDGAYELGQWRFRKLYRQFTSYTYCDGWVCMKDGLTARILVAYFKWFDRHFFNLATWESKRRTDFVSGETLPINSISGLWGWIDMRFRRFLCQ